MCRSGSRPFPCHIVFISSSIAMSSRLSSSSGELPPAATSMAERKALDKNSTKSSVGQEFPDSMLRSFACWGMADDRARLALACLCASPVKPCKYCEPRHEVTLRRGPLNSCVLSFLDRDTIEHYGQSSTRHLETVRSFLDAAIPRCDCGCCAGMSR